MDTTLLVVTFDPVPVDDASIDEALARIMSPHTMLKFPRAREVGYGWQERHLKPGLVTLLQENVLDETHPLTSLNIAALPVQLVASLTTDALGLVELLEAAAEHRLARAAEGTSEEDYEASLYAEAGRQLAERLLRLLPDQVEAALEVVMTGGQGSWSDERFRTGAEALQKVGLAQVAGGSISLVPMARKANDGRILSALRERLSRSLSVLPPRRWFVETAFILGPRRPLPAANNLMASADASTGQHIVTESNLTSASRRSLEQVREWICNGSGFKDRCLRAHDFLGDPDRSKRARTDRHSEYDVWLDPIKCEFTEEDWKQLNFIHVNDDQYDETVTRTKNALGFPADSRSTFRGFMVLDRKRFSSHESISRQIDAFLKKRGDLKVDLARWMTFAFNEDLSRQSRPWFINLLCWVWRSAIDSSDDEHNGRDEAHDVMRRCLAYALKNNYPRLPEHIREDARAVGLDVSAVVAAGERPPEFLHRMKDGFEKVLNGAFVDARKAYEQAVVIANQRGDVFGEWVAFHGEEDAMLASINFMERTKEATQSAMDDYRRRRQAMEQAPKIKEWLDQARERRDRVVEETIEKFLKQNRQRSVGGRSMSFSNNLHDYWTMFRDLETMHAPPNLQRTHVRPLIDAGGFDPEEELHYRLQLGVDRTEKTAAWISRTIDDPNSSLEKSRNRNTALLNELTRRDTTRYEREQRLEVFPQILDILRVEDLDWAASFLTECKSEFGATVTTHRGWRALHHDYADGWREYAGLDVRPIVLDRLENYASMIIGEIESERFSRALRALPLEQWIGILPHPPDRMIRLVLDLNRHVVSNQQDVSDSDENIAWALFSIVRGATRFGRPIMPTMKQEVRAWAGRLLHKKTPIEHSYRHGAFTAAAHLAYLLAADDDARDDVVTDALARAADYRVPEHGMGHPLEGPLGVWVSLVEAGARTTSPAMTKAANDLLKALDATWDDALRFMTNNPHHAWSYVAFLADTIASEIATPISVARERLLQLVQVAPAELRLCAEVLDPRFWGERWQSFIYQVWKSSSGGESPDPVAARMGAVDLFARWVAHRADSAELPSELGFLVDVSLLALLDESPTVANHAAYSIVGYALRARAPAQVSRVVGALRRMAIDPRLGIRGAAAYAGKKLPLTEVAEEIRAVAEEIDKTMAEEPYAVIQRQRKFGELDGKYPPL